MPPTVQTAYDILGVSPGAGTDTIRQAYRSLAKQAHPDRAGGDPAAHERFLAIKVAYEILADPERRAAHDVDPSGVLTGRMAVEQRRAQLRRRKKRLMRLYD